jgi:acyl-CoA synthetase (AMP-forming)/AMP-acid ligase II
MTTIPDLLAARAAVDPHWVALRQFGSAGVTFTDWDRRSNSVAHSLLERGLDHGQRVGLLFDSADWIDFAVTYCAVQKAGAVAVPIYERATASEVEHILTSCAASFLVSAQPRPSLHGIRSLPFRDLDWGQASPVDIRIRPGDLAQILYTSGTTGEPKGVAANHANLAFGFSSSPRYRLFQHSDCLIHAFPIGTNAAQAMLIYAIVAHPSSLRLGCFDSERFCAAIEEFAVGTVFLVPAMAADLIESKAYEQHDLTSVIMVSSGGSTLAPSVARSLKRVFCNATVLNCYTSTEAMPAQTAMIVDDERPASVGLALEAVQIRAAGDHSAPLPAGQTGEIWLRCQAPPRAYYHDPTATAEIFRNGWVRTGDLGYLDREGYLYIVDRESDVIKCGSMKVSTREVEEVLHEHPLVREAAVVGLPHTVLGSMVAAAVVLKESGSLGDVRTFVRRRLAPHKVPVRWLELRDLPRNRMGKVIKPELLRLFLPGSRDSALPGS